MKKLFSLILLVFYAALVFSSCATTPAITEGRIVDKYADVQQNTIGSPEFNTSMYTYPSTTFITVQYYIVIKDKGVKQKVKVTPEEYEGLQIGWLVDCSKKFNK